MLMLRLEKVYLTLKPESRKASYVRFEEKTKRRVMLSEMRRERHFVAYCIFHPLGNLKTWTAFSFCIYFSFGNIKWHSREVPNCFTYREATGRDRGCRGQRVPA